MNKFQFTRDQNQDFDKTGAWDGAAKDWREDVRQGVEGYGR